MPISSNYITLQRQIADELGDKQELLSPLGDGSLTLSPIQNAIQAAIDIWERVPFYFNEIIDTNGFSTSAGQEFYGASTSPVSYAAIGTYARVIQMHVYINSQRYVFYPRTVQFMDATSVNPSVDGEPVDVSYFAEQFRFYPIPSAAWPVTVFGTQRFAALANDTDANCWTQDAEQLIRAEAKRILARDVLKDATLAQLAGAAVDRMEYVLRAEGIRRKRKGRIRPSHF